jgi:hypothetical protein
VRVFRTPALAQIVDGWSWWKRCPPQEPHPPTSEGLLGDRHARIRTTMVACRLWSTQSWSSRTMARIGLRMMPRERLASLTLLCHPGSLEEVVLA